MYISLLIKLISFLFLIAITGDFNVKYTSCEILEYLYFGNSKDTSFKVLFFSLALSINILLILILLLFV